MDPITHITTGIMGAQLVPKTDHKYVLLSFCMIAATLPDIDNLATLLGPEFYLIHHRGITHSLAGGLLISGLTVAIFKIFFRYFPVVKGWILSFLLVMIHIYLDLVTSYGTQIFYPITHFRYSTESVFIIDPFYTFSLMTLLYFSFNYKKYRKKLAIAGIAWVFLYPMANFGLQQITEYRVRNELNSEAVAFDKIHISTEIGTPILWKVIIEDKSSYHVGCTNIFIRKKPIRYQQYNKADPILLKKIGKYASIFETYSWFAGYPVMKKYRHGKKTAITFGDLRFMSCVRVVKKLLPDQKSFFSLTATFDEQNNLVDYSFQTPGKQRIIRHLE